MGGNLLPEIYQETVAIAVIFQETLVTAAKFLRNAGNCRYFSTKYRRFCDFFRRSAIIVEIFQSKVRPGSRILRTSSDFLVGNIHNAPKL